MKIKVGLADDQQLFLKSLAVLMGLSPHLEVMMEAQNGKELLTKLQEAKHKPDVILLDISMPVMDGFTTAEQIRTLHPHIKIAALSMSLDDLCILKMLRAGCCSYLSKDMAPKELEKAVVQIHQNGYYNSDHIQSNLNRLLFRNQESSPTLSKRENDFLQLACNDLTYKEIASKMFLSEKTIDGYRESLFIKFNVKSRVGMLIEAIKKGYVKVML